MSPMETNTAATPTSSSQPQSVDSLSAFSPKGGSMPDTKSASHPLDRIKQEPVDSAVTVSAGSGNSMNSATDSLNNNSGLNGHDRCGSAVDGQQSNGGSSAKSDLSSSVPLDSGSGHVAVGTSNNSSPLSFTPSLKNRPPHLWTAQDVCLFLSVNDCGACSETVLRKVK